MNPVLALIIANIIWGAAPPIFKYAIENIPPFTLVFLRFFFASFFFIPFVIGKNFNISRSDWARILISALIGIALHIAFFFLGLQRTQSIDAPVILSSGPIVMFIFTVFFLHEKPKFQVAAGMLLSFVGVLVIIFTPLLFQTNAAIGTSSTIGNIYLVISMVAGVIGTLVVKDTLKRVHPFVVTYISFLIAAFSFIPPMIGELQTWHYSMLDLPGITGLLFGIFFCSALAYFLYFYGLSKISMQDVGIFSYIDPVVSVVIAAPLLHEYPDTFFIAGAVLVFTGIYFAERRIHWHPLHRFVFLRKLLGMQPAYEEVVEQKY